MFLLAAMLIAAAAFGQNKEKAICASFFMEVPVERGYLFNGLNFGVGAWFGEQTPFTSIGVFVGVLTYQPYSPTPKPIIQKGTATVAFDIHTNSRIFISPAFVVGTKDFFDLNIKLGFAIDKQRTMIITGFASQTYNMGIGFMCKLK